MLNQDGALFISVDIGGEPTPDEPTVFSVESLRALLQDDFDVVSLADHHPPHSAGRPYSVRAVARKKPGARQRLNKHEILRAYEDRLPPSVGSAAASVVDGGL